MSGDNENASLSLIDALGASLSIDVRHIQSSVFGCDTFPRYFQIHFLEVFTPHIRLFPPLTLWFTTYPSLQKATLKPPKQTCDCTPPAHAYSDADTEPDSNSGSDSDSSCSNITSNVASVAPAAAASASVSATAITPRAAAAQQYLGPRRHHCSHWREEFDQHIATVLEENGYPRRSLGPRNTHVLCSRAPRRRRSPPCPAALTLLQIKARCALRLTTEMWLEVDKQKPPMVETRFFIDFTANGTDPPVDAVSEPYAVEKVFALIITVDYETNPSHAELFALAFQADFGAPPYLHTCFVPGITQSPATAAAVTAAAPTAASAAALAAADATSTADAASAADASTAGDADVDSTAKPLPASSAEAAADEDEEARFNAKRATLPYFTLSASACAHSLITMPPGTDIVYGENRAAELGVTYPVGTVLVVPRAVAPSCELHKYSLGDMPMFIVHRECTASDLPGGAAAVGRVTSCVPKGQRMLRGDASKAPFCDDVLRWVREEQRLGKCARSMLRFHRIVRDIEEHDAMYGPDYHDDYNSD